MKFLRSVIKEIKEVWAMLSIAFSVGFVVGAETYAARQRSLAHPNFIEALVQSFGHLTSPV